ncbi:MAG: hypothetical protein QOF37_2115 [Thermoleophilaceae bacterium]|nr:hypothetical protein [Thermoleophilaceae bacterium]
MNRRTSLFLAALAALMLTVPAAAHAVGFSQPIFVDKELAGGEPLVATDGKHSTLVYTSHEGTTHLYQPGFFSPLPFGVNYRNQVNIWTSDDEGGTWQRTGVAGFSADPTKSAGFSDPDLTVDESGRIYNTGIDLVNDSIFSSQDGGKTYDRGNANCHNGDRPWLAGGKANEVFLATNTAENTLSHQIFQSTDGGDNCSTTGISDQGTTSDGQLDYTGAGKLYYSHVSQRLIEPIVYTDHANPGPVVALGVGTWNRGDSQFTPHKILDTTMYAHWPALAIDSSDNVYMVWDDNPTVTGTTQGCDGNPTPAANSIKMAVSKDFGQTWSSPITIAHPSNGRAFWPWIAAGDTGKVSVVWYQSDRIADLDCQTANVSIFESQILDATSAQPTLDTVNAAGRPISVNNSVCQGGTLCVAEMKDRRLGDFFTNGVDNRGCVLISSGDTTQSDPNTGQPLAISLPIFIRQTSGAPLRGNGSCNAPRTAPTAAGRGQCRDRIAPVSKLKVGNVRASRRIVRLKGTSGDRGCNATATAAGRKGHVLRVYVSIAKVRGRHSCRFLNAQAQLEPLRNCRRPTLLPANGTGRWSFALRAHLPQGRYRAVARGLDVSGNKERPRKRRPRNQVAFRIR